MQYILGKLIKFIVWDHIRVIYFQNSSWAFLNRYHIALSNIKIYYSVRIFLVYHLDLGNLDFIAFSIHEKKTYHTTRIKATRCATLRTVSTNNSKKHSHLSYCLNVSFMVRKGTATIFSTSEHILLIVHETYLFLYVTNNI